MYNNSIYHKFPENLAIGAAGGPIYSTDIITTTNGKEQRNVNWQYPRLQYEISQTLKSAKDLETINSFFRLHQGKAKPFRFKDWTDYKACNEFIGFTSSIYKEHQLIKSYRYGTQNEMRFIRKLVNKTLKVKVGGKPVTFNVDVDTGIITFKKPQMPNQEIRASFEFDVLVRFDSDHLKINSLDAGDAYLNITLIEVKE